MPTRGRRRNLIVLEPRCKSETEIGPSIEQLNLEKLIGLRREIRELEESIGIALSKGARVEPGIHTAELVPFRRRGELFMKLIIVILFLAMLPAVCSRASLIEDVNGDGKIDILDFITESGATLPSGQKESPHA